MKPRLFISAVRTLALGLVFFFVAAPRARAQGDDGKAAAQKMMATGAQAMEQGQPADALRLFREAYRLVPNPRYQYNIGVACQATGRDAEALEAFQIFLEKAQGVAREYTEDAKKQVDLLRTRVVTVTVVASVGGAGVLVDGRDVGTTPLTQPLVLDAGEHRFLVRKLSYEPFERAVTLRPGEHFTVNVDLHPLVSRSVDSTATRAPAVIVQGPATPAAVPVYKRWWLWTAIGAAVIAGAVVAVAAGSRSGGLPCPGGEAICVE